MKKDKEQDMEKDTPATAENEQKEAEKEKEVETETTGGESAVTPEEEIASLLEDNAKLAKAFEESNDRYLRMMAEYDNYRKRAAKERDGIFADAYAEALKEILPVIDNLERAMQYANADSPIDDKLAEGVVMTLNQFGEALKKMGIEAIGAVGETFNPELHNAVMHVEEEQYGENEIVEVFLKGYKRGDRVIRYAMVKVAN